MKKLFSTVSFILCAAMLASPASAVTYTAYKMGEYLSEETERLRDQPAEQHYTVTYYKDAEQTEQYADVSEIPADADVYYEIMCDDGYYVKWIAINAEYMDGDVIRFGGHAPNEPDINCVRAGDINSDYVVNLGDVTILLRHMSVTYYDYITEMVEADFNGDGKFNLSDISVLLKYIAGWDVELLGKSQSEPEIYCQFDSGKVTSYTYLNDRFLFLYNYTVVKDTADLEEYISKYGVLFTLDPGAEYGYYADDLRDAYGEEFFAENELVLFDFADCIATGDVYVENTGNMLRIAVRNVRKTGVPFDGKTVFHKQITVPKDSGIDLDAGIEIYTRDANTYGARYLRRVVDEAVDEDFVNNDRYIELIEYRENIA